MSGVRTGGPVRLHPTTFVAPGAVVAGDVILGPRSSVWFNTVVRGDSAPVELGEGSNLQDNGVVHVDEGQPAHIGARVTVGHRAIIHGCVIEDDCLVGMGSVVLSGARVGAGSLLGASSLVLEGQIIPPGSFVLGAPARVVGPAGPEHREAVRRGASHYVELARAYLESGLARCADRAGAVTRDRGPMALREWEELVRALADGPAWVELRIERHAPEAWKRSTSGPSPLGRLGRLRDVDREIRGPCLERLLRGQHAEVLEPPAEWESPSRIEGEPRRLLQDWRDIRGALCRSLAPLGPENWRRAAGHPTRGPFLLPELLREWVEEDLEARRDIARALGEAA